MKLGEPTLDQLRLFLAVVDHGSFGGAARRLGRAVSAVSYGIAQMEAQLGVTLFEREGSRKPRLSDAGRGLLAEARAVTDRADALLAKTRSIHSGLESDVSLVLDVMLPAEAVARVLRDFRALFPTVTLRLNIEGLGAVAACLLGGDAQLGVGGPVIGDHPELEMQRIGSVELVPVAAPDHPLARRAVAPGEAREHLQLILSDRSDLTRGREFAVLGRDSWRLGDLGAKHELIRQGIGWGNMPRHLVAADLEAGRLVALELPEQPGGQYPFHALWRRNARPGPASSWLIDALRERLEKCPVQAPI